MKPSFFEIFLIKNFGGFTVITQQVGFALHAADSVSIPGIPNGA